MREGREWLDEVQAKELLEAYGISAVHTERARDAEAAVSSAVGMGFPVALKIVSPQVIHKSDVGGAELDLGSAEEVRAAAVSDLALEKRIPC